ncbi:HAD family hydrolase [Thiolinea disciformis]|uniref:HAD family hydrolase n=1 Tax=Thiolinea disciformis TaxID=125614 RepID=UPI000366459B|nr:HAD family hydrolase [Thiolinea disciformis]
MILIFDLDDTLYPEHTFVESGFQAVAEMLRMHYGWDESLSLKIMMDTLKMQGRGSVFNELLNSKNCFSKKLVQHCLQKYRQHKPNIQLFPEAKKILEDYNARHLYLVTDGNKNVQANKIQALAIEPFFRKIFITHRYSIKHAKPSIYCFDLIRKLEKCEWSDMAYIGDNPAKDFVNLNHLGVLTVRVLTGEHSKVIAKPGFDAKLQIQKIADLPSVLK